MTIQIVDRSKGKLWLAVNHLKDIVNADIGLHMSPSVHETYRPLWDLLQAPIDFTPTMSSLLKLIFIDQESDVGAEDGRCLYFPLVPFSYKSDERFIPSAKGADLPDRTDVQDMLFRLITPGDFTGKRILISAGPTAEDIDPVRFLSNRSTGKMGVAIARAAYIRGAEVQMVCGPLAVRRPGYLKCHAVRSAKAMLRIIQNEINDADIFIASAAVADYTIKVALPHKIKKGGGALSLELDRTTDILSALMDKKKKNQFFVGFSVETENLHKNSLDKMKRKGLDMIIANNPLEKGAGFAGDTNRVLIILPEKSKQLSLMSKFETANHILDFIYHHANAS